MNRLTWPGCWPNMLAGLGGPIAVGQHKPAPFLFGTWTGNLAVEEFGPASVTPHGYWAELGRTRLSLREMARSWRGHPSGVVQHRNPWSNILNVGWSVHYQQHSKGNRQHLRATIPGVYLAPVDGKPDLFLVRSSAGSWEPREVSPGDSSGVLLGPTNVLT